MAGPVLINRDSRVWVLVCTLLLVAACVVYWFIPGMGARRLDGPSGGTVEGLVLGVVGYAMMLFALLLGARKRVRSLRLGRAYWWCQGHVWFGIISFPIIILHGGFKPNFWGGPLTQVIMWIFVVVWVSGLVGLIIQQVMPNRLLNTVPMETIYEQIDHIIAQLKRDAEKIVRAVQEKTKEESEEAEEAAEAGGATATATRTVTIARTGAEAEAKLATFYRQNVAPILVEKIPKGTPLARDRAANAMFAQLRDTMPLSLRKPVQDLADICEERRQLNRQRRLHHVLHGWLLFHVPLSYALMVLATVHAIQAPRYRDIPGWVLPSFVGVLGLVLGATVVILLYGMVKKRR